MALDEKKNRQLLSQLLDKPGNEVCVDCGAPDNTWASYTLGVFICQSCSGLHRNITYISKVKSVLLDPWSDSEVEFLASMGNTKARGRYEQRLPPFYYRPTHTDCTLLREQWIRARYERKEFVSVERQKPYSSGYREGLLWKRGKDNGLYLSRRFVLSEREGVLKYYKPEAKEPKAVMKLSTLNATFQPTKMGNAHGLQITSLKDNTTRNVFVYHMDGKEMVDWFNAIRAARFHYLQVAYPGAAASYFVPQLTRNYLKEGYMEKTGPKHNEGYKKRWFTLDDRRLMYFKHPLDAGALGEVFIGSKDSGYAVLPVLSSSSPAPHWHFGITIVTPDRKFLFACETEEERKDWLAVFHSMLDRPMLPQEYAVEARFKS